MKIHGFCYIASSKITTILLAFNVANALTLEILDGILSSRHPKLRVEEFPGRGMAGDNITFVCSYPYNATFNWNVKSEGVPLTAKGITIGMTNTTKDVSFWSKLTIFHAPAGTGHVTCFVNRSLIVAAIFHVPGKKAGETCTRDGQCTTNNCKSKICTCRPDEVLVSRPPDKNKVCHKQSDIITHKQYQELYRVGLVAITCLIIIVVAASLWITLTKSCQNENRDSQRRSVANDEQLEEVAVDIPNDEPPSYDDVLESSDTISSPPNFKEALKSSVTAKKFLRQSSAPAGQLLKCNAVVNTQPNAKANHQEKITKKGS